MKKGVHLGWEVSILSRKRGQFDLKSQCFATKKGVIFKLENKDGYHFFQWVRELGIADNGQYPYRQLGWVKMSRESIYI